MGVEYNFKVEESALIRLGRLVLALLKASLTKMERSWHGGYAMQELLNTPRIPNLGTRAPISGNRGNYGHGSDTDLMTRILRL